MHVNICCRDFQKSLHFYTEILGATLHQTMDDAGYDVRPAMGVGDEYAYKYEACLLYWGEARGGPYIDLLEWVEEDGVNTMPEPRPPLGPQDLGLVRIALEVDNVDEWLAKLKSQGVPATTPQDIMVGPWPVKIVLIQDPDGTLIELVEFPNGYSRK